MSQKIVFICDLPECNMFLDQPVALNCGYTICKKHINETIDNDKYKCVFCQEFHSNMLTNLKLISLLVENHHLNGQHLEAKKTFDEIKEDLKKFEKDPDAFIFDIFQELRRQIDLHRDQSIEKTRKQSQEMIEQLSELEFQYT